MLALALALAIVGSGLVVGSVLIFWHKRDDAHAAIKREDEYAAGLSPIICEAPSPDDRLRCNQEIGHWGWHRHAETSWMGGVWNCDHWADTQAAPISEPQPEPEPIAAEPTRVTIPPIKTRNGGAELPDYMCHWFESTGKPTATAKPPTVLQSRYARSPTVLESSYIAGTSYLLTLMSEKDARGETAYRLVFNDLETGVRHVLKTCDDRDSGRKAMRQMVSYYLAGGAAYRPAESTGKAAQPS